MKCCFRYRMRLRRFGDYTFLHRFWHRNFISYRCRWSIQNTALHQPWNFQIFNSTTRHLMEPKRILKFLLYFDDSSFNYPVSTTYFIVSHENEEKIIEYRIEMVACFVVCFGNKFPLESCIYHGTQFTFERFQISYLRQLLSKWIF